MAAGDPTRAPPAGAGTGVDGMAWGAPPPPRQVPHAHSRVWDGARGMQNKGTGGAERAGGCVWRRRGGGLGDWCPAVGSGAVCMPPHPLPSGAILPSATEAPPGRGQPWVGMAAAKRGQCHGVACQATNGAGYLPGTCRGTWGIRSLRGPARADHALEGLLWGASMPSHCRGRVRRGWGWGCTVARPPDGTQHSRPGEVGLERGATGQAASAVHATPHTTKLPGLASTADDSTRPHRWSPAPRRCQPAADSMLRMAHDDCYFYKNDSQPLWNA